MFHRLLSIFVWLTTLVWELRFHAQFVVASGELVATTGIYRMVGHPEREITLINGDAVQVLLRLLACGDILDHGCLAPGPAGAVGDDVDCRPRPNHVSLWM